VTRAPRHPPLAIDLFCGAAGGWSLGLQRAGIRTIAACEIDDWRRAVFAARHPGCVMYSDVRDLTAERIGNDLGYLPDILVGSPPCQEISAANCKGEGITDDHLFWEWARLVFEIRPLWCAAENSPRARTDGIDGILDALAQAGYAAWPCVVGADNAGANHRRKRLWLIAADAQRRELWQQPGRSAGTDGRAPAIASEHDPNAYGRIAGGTGRHADGCLGLGAGADEYDARHAASQRRAEGGAEPSEQSQGADAGSYDGEELPPALRDIGLDWPHWNGGLAGLAASCAAAGFGAVDDGPGSILPPGLRNRAIAALGDAVVPQITEAIGRVMIGALA